MRVPKSTMIVLAIAGAVFLPRPSNALGQEPVDLRRWTAESYPAVDGFDPGVWTVSADGSSVFQSVNGQPTLFYSDFNAFGAQFEGIIRVGDGGDDNDFIGFAIGFRPGDTSGPDADYLLIDWKQVTQVFHFGSPSCTPGSTAPRGLAISRVFGVPSADEFWGHTNFDSPACSDLNNGVQELARAINLGNTGWARNTDYRFAFEFSADNLKVFVNEVLEFDIAGQFSDGRFAFYNFSQENVTYSGLTVIGPCLSALPDARCVDGRGAGSRGEPFPPCGLDDFATGASFKVIMLDGTELGVGVWVDGGGVHHGSPAVDPNTIIGRSDPFFEGDPEDDGALICGGGQPPYPDTAAIAGDPCVFPAGFPEDSTGGHEIHTEILSLNLVDPDGNTVKAGQPFFDAVVGTPQERFYQNSLGEVQGLDNDFPADSLFNVFVEVHVAALNQKFYNKTPMVLRAEITSFPPDLSLPRSVYLHDPSFGATPLFDEDGLHVAYLLSSGHGATDLEPPPLECDVATVLSSPVSFAVDDGGLGSFPPLAPNHVSDDDGQDIQQVTAYVSSGSNPGSSPDITNIRIDRLVGDLTPPAPPAFAPGDAINSFSYGRDGSRDAEGEQTFGTLLFSVDRGSLGESCTSVRLGSEPAVPEQAADIYMTGGGAFGGYAGPFLPKADAFANILLGDQTVLGLRPSLQGTGQDDLTGLEVSAFTLGDRFYGTFLGDSFDCGNEDCNTNGIPDGCEPDCQPNGVVDECDIDPTDPDGNGSVSGDLNGNGIPDECEPCDASCTTPARSLKGATIFVYDDQGDPGANPFRPGNLQVFSLAADLGLQPGDVIDALVLSDLTPGGGAPTPNGVMDMGLDEVLFSLSRGSPSLFGPDGAPGVAGVDDDGKNGVDDFGETGMGDDLSPADIFYSSFGGTFLAFSSSSAMGLLPTDNTDALDIGPTLMIVDCNCNDIEDACDISRTFSNDCNTNAIPDECERSGNDCNCNDIPDECDIDAGTSLDCNGNGEPDECEPGCGDGFVCGIEECDDGNTDTCDGCNAVCVIEFCGDGVLCESLGEQCDDENTDNCDGCRGDCSALEGTCGDGTCDSNCEDCRVCPDDCPCPQGLECVAGLCQEVCGNSTCQPDLGEDCKTCPQDCADCFTDEHCSDGGLCNGLESCVNNCCEPGLPLPEGTPCTDEDVCTYRDACDGEGICIGTPIPFPDCPLCKALEGASQRRDYLAVLHNFRDTILANSPEGQYYIGLYYLHAEELARLMLLHPHLRMRSTDIVVRYVPALRRRLAGEDVALTTADIRTMEKLLSAYEQHASRELRDDLQEIRVALRKGKLTEIVGISVKHAER